MKTKTGRWLAIWLLLTGIYLAGWAVAGWLLHGRLALNPESLAGLAAIPFAQTAALRGLAAFRRMFRDAGTADNAGDAAQGAQGP